MKSGLFSFCLFHSSVDTKLIAALFLEGLNMEKLNSKWRAKRSSSCRSQKWKRAQGNYRSLRLWFFFRLPKKETEECMIRTLQCIHQCSQNEMLFCLSLSPQSSTRLLWMGYLIFKYPDTWKKKKWNASFENRNVQMYPAGIQSTPKSVSPSCYKNFTHATKASSIQKARKKGKESQPIVVPCYRINK